MKPKWAKNLKRKQTRVVCKFQELVNLSVKVHMMFAVVKLITV